MALVPINPSWLSLAYKYIGLQETPGPATTPKILEWLTKLKAWWKDDETPWCGTFVAGVMVEAGFKDTPSDYYRAKAWLNYGVGLNHPVRGCIVVLDRSGGGHVAFAVGFDPRSNILLLGGNQGNQVSVAAFDPSRVLGYRWPTGVVIPDTSSMVVLANAQLSKTEA